MNNLDIILKLNKLLEYSQAKIPYYTNLFEQVSSKIDYRSFSDIPLLDTYTAHKNENFLCANPREDKENDIFMGALGLPLKIVRSKAERTKMSMQLTIERRKYLQGLTKKPKMAIFSASIKEITKYDAGTGFLELSLIDINEEKLEIQIKAILEYKSQILIGPPSIIVRLARMCAENGLRMDHLELIEGRSEIMTFEQRQEIERVCACPITNVFGNHEYWVIGYTCEKNLIHIIDEQVMLEVIDNTGRSLSYGSKGELVMTSLTNFSMPLIRYKLGIEGILHPPNFCSCQRNTPIIEFPNYKNYDWIKTSIGLTSPSAFIKLFRTLSSPRYIDIQKINLIQKSIKNFECIIYSKAEKSYNETELLPIYTAVSEVIDEDIEVKFISKNLKEMGSDRRWFLNQIPK